MPQTLPAMAAAALLYASQAAPSGSVAYLRCVDLQGDRADYRVALRAGRIDSYSRRGEWEKLCDAKDNVAMASGGVTLTKSCLVRAGELYFSYRSSDGRGDLIRRFLQIDRMTGRFTYEAYFRGVSTANGKGEGRCRAVAAPKAFSSQAESPDDLENAANQ